jgi:hypothetical protein
VQPSSIGTLQHGGRQVLYLLNHGINSRVFCDCFSVILVFARARYLAILTLNQVLWLLVVEFHRITYSPPSRCSQRLYDAKIYQLNAKARLKLSPSYKFYLLPFLNHFPKWSSPLFSLQSSTKYYLYTYFLIYDFCIYYRLDML